MNKVKEYLKEYCQVCLGVDGPLKGLDHNNDFKEFVSSAAASSLLMGFDEKTLSLVIGGEGSFDCWILLSKAAGSLEKDEPADMLDIMMSTNINDIKELLSTHVQSVILTNDCTADSIESKIVDALKTDLFTNVEYLAEMQRGNLSIVDTFADEAYIQQNFRDLIQLADADRFATVISRIATYTDPTKEHSSSQMDNSVSEVVSSFKDLLAPNAQGKSLYPRERVERLIKIYADRLFKEAQNENSQIDLFDYENCNLRLKLSMWKDILKKYQTEVEDFATAAGLAVAHIFAGAYSEYIKKLASANYLRGSLS